MAKEPREQISVRLPASLLADIDRRAADEGSDRTGVIVGAIQRSLHPTDVEANFGAIQLAVNDHDDRIEKLERLAEAQGASL